MPSEHHVRRYSAYYRGWCLSFGEHDPEFSEEESINWVFREEQAGFIVTDELRRRLFRAMLGRGQDHPVVQMTDTHVFAAEMEHRFTPAQREGAQRFREFIRQHTDLHLFLTSHFWYPSGTRIITFSSKRPVIVLYKEISPLHLKIE